MKKKYQSIIFMIMGVFCMLWLSGESVAKAESKMTAPIPQNLKVSVDSFKAKVSFKVEEPEADIEVVYRIQCCKNTKWKVFAYNTTSSKPEVTIKNLKKGERYYFRVRAEIVSENGEKLDKSIKGKWSNVVYKNIAANPVNVTSVEPVSSTKIKLTWEKVKNVTGYRIYRSTNKKGTYSLVKTVTGASNLTWTDTGKNAETDYYYKVCTYNKGYTYKNGQFSKIMSARTSLSKVSLTAKTNGIRSIKLLWDKPEENVDGYIIYRADAANGEFAEITSIDSGNTTAFKNVSLTFGNYYYYKIKSFYTVNGTTYYSEESDVAKARAMITAPSINSTEKVGVGEIKIGWKKVSDASGYRIYRATSKTGTYKSIATISNNTTFSYKDSKLSNGKMYYYKVRAYRLVDGKKYWGSYSEIKGSRTKIVAKKVYATKAKAQKVFGEDYYIEYETAADAVKDMTTIKVKCWDLDEDGKKYTRYHSLTVHKNIASTVKKIFNEIYNGKEKFPIKSVGGYSWRGSSSASEHCEGVAIDINPNENAQFSGYNGKPLVGSLYKPGKNPYSIPADGEVVKIFAKYGFSWGDWFYNPDYMHFSYFGT